MIILILAYVRVDNACQYSGLIFRHFESLNYAKNTDNLGETVASKMWILLAGSHQYLSGISHKAIWQHYLTKMETKLMYLNLFILNAF